MKRTVPFEIFGANQWLQFDILRLSRLEEVLGKPIAEVIASQNIGVNFALKALPIAMSQHYRNATPQDFAKKIEDHLDNGGSFDDIAVPLVRAILASGFLGKAVADRAMGIVAETDEVADEPKNEQGTAIPSEPFENG